MTVYAFEWCDCIYESAFAAVSLHMTKLGAYRAMKARIFNEWEEDRQLNWRSGLMRRVKPLDHKAWRITSMEVQP